MKECLDEYSYQEDNKHKLTKKKSNSRAMETRAKRAIEHNRKHNNNINTRMREERPTTRRPRTRNTANRHELLN
jgi:hypothetical protein